MKININTDGSSDFDLKYSGFGWLIKKDGELIKSKSEASEKFYSNNEEEYRAIIDALKSIDELLPDIGNEDRIVINTDSQLIVRHLSGHYRIRSNKLKPLFFNLKEVAENFNCPIEIRYIERKLNSDADSLAKEGLNRARDNMYL